MTFWKLPFIITDSILMRINATPPNPPVPPQECIIPDWREHFLRSLALPAIIFRAMYWVACFTEVAVILSNRNPAGPISKFLLHNLILQNESIHRIRITPLFIIGHFLTVCGTILRIACYRSLGYMFTFELCIRRNHKLVVDGPYSIIRHPSYAGLMLTIFGVLCSNATGSWVTECGLLATAAGQTLLCMWLAVAAAVVLSLILRIPREEEILRAKFGPEWETWRLRVPYKLLPGLY